MQINKTYLKKILQAPTIEGKQVYYFELNKYKDNYESLLKAVYLYLRKTMKYKTNDILQLRAKIDKFPNWQLIGFSKKNYNEFQNLLLAITY